MKRKKPTETDHSKISWAVKKVLTIADLYGIEIEFKLADRMAERNLTVRELAAITGLRLATISDIMNGNRVSMNFQHLTIIMLALRLSKLSDLIDIKIPDFLTDLYNNESEKWITTGQAPEVTYQLKQCFSISKQDEKKYDELFTEAYITQKNKMKRLKEEFNTKKRSI